MCNVDIEILSNALKTYNWSGNVVLIKDVNISQFVNIIMGWDSVV